MFFRVNMEEILRKTIISFVKGNDITKFCTLSSVDKKEYVRRYSKVSITKIGKQELLTHQSKGIVPTWDDVDSIISTKHYKEDQHKSNRRELKSLLLAKYGMPKFLGGMERVVDE